MSFTDCLECSLLWAEYSRATRDQLLLLEQVPSLGSSLEQLEEFERKVDELAEGRELAWQKIRAHEQQVHTAKPSGQ